MYNQRNYQQFGQRLPPPPPPQFQQAGPAPYRPPVSVPPTGTLTSGQSFSIPPPPPSQNPNWSQSQHPNPRIPPPYPQGQHFYRVPPPPLAPLPASSYFTPAPFGSFAPPPPPPSSPPPGPPPLPPSPPSNSKVNDSETSVKDTSEFNILSDIPPPPPRDEKTVKKIEVLCQYIAKNGDEFEHMTCQKEIGNPEFEFLFGGAPGSQAAISHEYFKWMKKKCVSSELLERGHSRDLSHSPTGSDMDMEDDITQPEEPGLGKSFESANREPDFISNEVEIKPKEGHKPAPDDNQFENPTMTVGVVDSEQSVDSKTEQFNIDLHQEMNQSKESPFRLIQGYASDDSSENDNEPHFENVSPVNEPFFENLSPVAVSPQVKNSTTLSVPVVDGSLNITSNIPEPSTKTKILDSRNDGTSIEGDDTTGRKYGGAQKEDSSTKLEVDEFGRMVKKGGGESDSDDYNRRRSKRRRRSRSRSRSPYERRRRSPRRRRENRSRSRSRSPKRRNRSRSPYNRRNRSHLQEICHDFRLGRCFRGENCRYFHDTEKIEESWRHRNKQHYLEPVSDRFQNPDKLVPEKDEVHNHTNRNESVNKEFVESPGHTGDVTNEPPAAGAAMPGGEPQLAGEYNVMQLPPSSLWNSLPPPPPRPQLGGPMPQYQQNQPSFQTNYPFQPFVTPYGPQITTHLGVYRMNYPILQQPLGPTSFGQDNFPQISSSPNLVSSNSRPVGPTSFGQDNFALISSSPNLVSSNSRPVGPTSFGQDNFAQISSSPNLVSSNSREPPAAGSFLQNPVADNISEFARSRILSHYNPYASTFDKPLSNKFDSSLDQNNTPEGDQYDPLFDSIDPSSLKKSDNGTKEVAVAVTASEENDEFGETADAEVGAVENDSHSPSSPIDLRDVGTGEIEIDQVKPKKSKDSRSMKLFKVSVADFVKEVLKPSWRQGNMSKEAFKTIVKKTVDKVSGAMKKHQVPKSQAKINHYIDSSQRKLTKLVMGYVDKYVKV